MIKKLALYKEKCSVDGHKDGPALLKTVISVIFIDTRAKVTLIRTQLVELDKKMLELNYDVEEFNLFVTKLLADLSARGEATNNLFTNLIT